MNELSVHKHPAVVSSFSLSSSHLLISLYFGCFVSVIPYSQQYDQDVLEDSEHTGLDGQGWSFFINCAKDVEGPKIFLRSFILELFLPSKCFFEVLSEFLVDEKSCVEKNYFEVMNGWFQCFLLHPLP